MELEEALVQGNVSRAFHFCFQQDGFGTLPLVSRQTPDVVLDRPVQGRPDLST